MTTWQEAGDKWATFVQQLNLGTVDVPPAIDRGRLLGEIGVMMDTFPVAQPTRPHDVGMLVEVMRCVYLMGYGRGADDTRHEILNYPSLRSE